MPTSTIAADVRLTDFSGEVSLTVGVMSATVPLGDLTADQRRAAIQYTTPGRCGILATRNGFVVGEWIIWKRTRAASGTTLKISGSETVSILDRRLMHAWTYTGLDQMMIAYYLLNYGFNNYAGSAAVTVPVPSASGVTRDRVYKEVDGFIGARTRELSQVDGGFEFYLSTSLTLAGSATVQRVVTFAYPRAGADTPLVFELAGLATAAAGNVVATGVDEDGGTLASTAYATGANTGETAVIGVYTDTALVTAGYLYTERVVAHSTVSTQSGVDAYARELWTDSQTAELPNGLVVLADEAPLFGDYHLGDRVTLYIEPTVVFPSGYTSVVRVLGWTLKPPNAGPETVTLTILVEQ